MAEQNCRQCGAELDPNDVFCKNCGARVTPAPAQGEYVSTAYSNYNASQEQGIDYAQNDVGYAHSDTPTSGAAIETIPLGTGQYLLMMFLSGIPVIGFIVMLVMAFSAQNINRRNFARATLIISLIAVVLLIVFTGVIFALIATIGSDVEFF